MEESAANRRASDIPWEETKLFAMFLNAKPVLSPNIRFALFMIQAETRFQNVDSIRAKT
jgi:hypothetical protein